MIIQRAYKTELDPNNKQCTFFRQCAGAARYVYNWGLAEWKQQREAGEKPSEYGVRRRFNAIKDEQCPWVRLIPYAVTEKAMADLGAAFQHFFRRVRNGEAKLGYPKFKKRGGSASFGLKNTKVESNRVRLTGVGWVRLKERDYLPVGADLGTYVVISETAGRWYISVQAEVTQPETQLGSGSIGVDLGLQHLAVCSDGTVFDNPKPLYQTEKKLARAQRELSRRTKGGQNWKKSKVRVARLHAKVTCIRRHAQHQVSHYVTADAAPAVIVVEDLNISGMLQNHHLARAVSDAGMYELRRQIEYKAEWAGIQVLEADRWYPSSKTCSGCGSVKVVLGLGERRYVCPECGLVIDRDLNAAINLASLAQVGD